MEAEVDRRARAVPVEGELTGAARGHPEGEEEEPRAEGGDAEDAGHAEARDEVDLHGHQQGAERDQEDRETVQLVGRRVDQDDQHEGAGPHERHGADPLPERDEQSQRDRRGEHSREPQQPAAGHLRGTEPDFLDPGTGGRERIEQGCLVPGEGRAVLERAVQETVLRRFLGREGQQLPLVDDGRADLDEVLLLVPVHDEGIVVGVEVVLPAHEVEFALRVTDAQDLDAGAHHGLRERDGMAVALRVGAELRAKRALHLLADRLDALRSDRDRLGVAQVGVAAHDDLVARHRHQRRAAVRLLGDPGHDVDPVGNLHDPVADLHAVKDGPAGTLDAEHEAVHVVRLGGGGLPLDIGGEDGADLPGEVHHADVVEGARRSGRLRRPEPRRDPHAEHRRQDEKERARRAFHATILRQSAKPLSHRAPTLAGVAPA